MQIRIRSIGRIAGLVMIVWLATAAVLRAQVAAGSVRGRVFNTTTGTYAKNARVSVDGTAVQTFTDEFGEYTLAGVPSGEAVTVRAFFTGLGEQTASVTIEPGGSVTQNFELAAGPASTAPASDEVIQLEAFEVRTSGEIAASAVAINEQRFAANVKSVVDIGEFGDLGESNIGEFIKFLPSVSIEYNGNEPRTVAVRGFPANYTAITIDGNRAASAASGQINRNSELVGFALHNLARIEVTKTPTPDTPADAIGGSVDLISRSAFERRHPYFGFHAYGTFNSDDISLGTSHGPSERTSGSTIRPGFDFVYQNPINQKLGISLNGQYFQRLSPAHIARTEWSPTSARIGTGTETNPYLSRFQLLEGPQDSETSSLGVVVDYRLTPRDVFTVGTNFVKRETYTDIQQMEFMVGDNPVSYGADYTDGAAVGRAGFANSDYRHKTSQTSHTSLAYKHNGTLWKADGGLFYSRATNAYRDISDGYFRGVIIRRRNVDVNYTGISPTGPASISVTAGGVPLNPFTLDDLLPEQGSSEESDATDILRGGHFDLSRDLGTVVPVVLKTGFDLREQHRDIDIRSDRWNFRGPDHSGSRPTSGANSELVKDLLARYNFPSLATDHYAENAPSFGYPVVQWPSPDKFYQFFRQTWALDPLLWQEDTAFRDRDSATRSPEITETVASGYLRGDAKFLDSKLWIVGGVRYEATRVNAYGFLNDNTTPGGFTYIRRGDHRITTYDDFFPSLNLSYKLGRNLIARLAWSQTIARPNFAELAPGNTIDNDAAPIYRIIANNPDLRPAYSDNYDLSLEYYFEESGVLSLGLFRKEIDDFFGQTVRSASQEDLDALGLDASYLGSDLVEKMNAGHTRVDGVELNYKQALTFLPSWARGVQIFGNGTLMNLQGDNLSDFTGFQRRAFNWGFKVDRERFDFSLNWSYSGRQRGLLVTGVGVPDNTFEYVESRLLLDANFGVHLTKRLEFYGSARNLTGQPIERLRYSPGTPGYAQHLRYEEYGVQFTLGLRGTF